MAKLPVVYVVHVTAKDALWGDSDEYVIRLMRKPYLMIPYQVRPVASFEEGERIVREAGYAPQRLEQRNERAPSGYYIYGEPTDA